MRIRGGAGDAPESGRGGAARQIPGGPPQRFGRLAGRDRFAGKSRPLPKDFVDRQAVLLLQWPLTGRAVADIGRPGTIDRLPGRSKEDFAMISIGTPLMWSLFAAFVLVALAIDFLAMNRQGAHTVTMREAGLWSLVWVAVSFVFVGWMWWYLGGASDDQAAQAMADAKALEFVTGYLVEKALAVDNVFVFLMLFTYFAVPLGIPEAGADDRHPRRAGAACGDDPGRRLADRAVPLGPVPVRRLPGLHRHQDVVGRGPGARPGVEPGAALDQPARARSRRATTASASSRHSRTACGWRRRCSW